MSVDSFLAPPPSADRERVTPVMPIDWTCSFREVAQSAATAGYECYFLFECVLPHQMQYEYKNE